MLKFFRRIRIGALLKGSTRKYFFYALGEIGLVVIGILLALQINNWNENKKANDNEAYMLNELLNNINEDADQISIIINRRSQAQKSVETLLNVLTTDDGKGPIDNNDVANFLGFERYYPLNNVFEMMKATGLKLSNKELRSDVSRYFDFEQQKAIQSIKDVENVFIRIMHSENEIRSNLKKARTGSNVDAEIELKDPNNQKFRLALENELIPFQDNNRASLSNIKAFFEVNQKLKENIISEVNKPKYSRFNYSQ